MSEFSESFHLRAEEAREGIDLLKQSGFTGVVFEPASNWVTIVPQTPLLQAVNAFVSRNRGTMLHYVFGEDHGWSFSIYEGSERVIHYECIWDPELIIDESQVDVDALEAYIDPSRRSELDGVLHPKLEDIRSVHHKFADLFGLTHYEWLSGEYLDGIDHLRSSIAYNDSDPTTPDDAREDDFPTWQELWKEADALYDQARYAEAFGIFHQAVALLNLREPGATIATGGLILDRDRHARALGFVTHRRTMCPPADKAGGCALAQGVLCEFTGDPDGALEAYTLALQAYRSTGNRGFEGRALYNIGLIHHTRRRHAQALDYFQQAREIERQVGDQVMEYTALNAIGAIYEAQARYAEALEIYHEVLTTWREADEMMGKIIVLGSLGRTYKAQGQEAEAHKYRQQALTIQREWDSWFD